MCYCWNGKGVGEQQAKRREEEGSEGQGNKMAPKCIRRSRRRRSPGRTRRWLGPPWLGYHDDPAFPKKAGGFCVLTPRSACPPSYEAVGVKPGRG